MSYPHKYAPLGHGSTVFGTATAPGTITLPSGVTDDMVKRTVIWVGGEAINYRDDGTNPGTGTSGTVGFPVAANSQLTYEANPSAFKAQLQSVSGTVTLSWAMHG